MKLVIVESPAKCNKIEGFLGKGYKCIASMGHIRNLKQVKRETENMYSLKWINDKAKQKTINTL